MHDKRDRTVGDRLSRLKCSADDAPTPPIQRAAHPGDLRAHTRRPCYKVAHVYSSAYETPCVIRDITVAGVRITVHGAIALPGRVTIHLDETKATQDARVAWQNGQEAGLEF